MFLTEIKQNSIQLVFEKIVKGKYKGFWAANKQGFSLKLKHLIPELSRVYELKLSVILVHANSSIRYFNLRPIEWHLITNYFVPFQVKIQSLADKHRKSKT